MAEPGYGTPVYGSAPGVEIAVHLDANPAGGPRQFCLIAELTVEAGLHVYGQPIPEGFIPLSLEVHPAAGLQVGTVAFPPPVWHQMEGLEEEFYIYEGLLTVAVPVTVSAENALSAVELKVRYQACGEMGCFMPQTITLQVPVPA